MAKLKYSFKNLNHFGGFILYKDFFFLFVFVFIFSLIVIISAIPLFIYIFLKLYEIIKLYNPQKKEINNKLNSKLINKNNKILK